MKNVAAVLAIVLFASSSAFAGVISFGPEVTIDRNAGDSFLFTLDLTVTQSDLGGWEGLDTIVGSNTLAITDWEWAIFPRFFEDSAPDTTVFDSGWLLGYFTIPANTPSHLLGTLSLDATGLADGDYTVSLDPSSFSALGLGNDLEALTGSTVVHIVPEPATLSLLALGAIGLIRRRRKA